MTNPHPPKTRLLAQIRQRFPSLQRLKPRVKVPRLEIRMPGERSTIIDLVSDRYLIGRNPQKCEIVIETPLVSQVHAELIRDSRSAKPNNFAIKDQNSTNGIYKQRHRIQAAPLKHNTIISLGPPELAAVVSIRYLDPPPWYLRSLRYAGYGAVSLILLAIGAIIVELQRVPHLRPLPVAEQGPIEILAGDNRTSLGSSDRPKHTELNRIEDFGTYIPIAVIASEDSSFYWNLGIDPIGIARAITTNLQKGELREGASTITQQLARNVLGSTYVGREDSPGRKWRELVAAIKLTFTYSKPEILNFYLNRVYLGNGIYGFQDAAKLYFNKSAAELDLSEAATLAGILPAPNLINPFRNRKLAIEYRDRVLMRLVNLGKVSPTEGERARRSVLKLNEAAKANLQGTIAPYFYSHVLDELYSQSEAIAKEGGLIVETYLDLSMQQAMNRTIQSEIATLGQTHGFSQAAMITLDSTNSSILAMVGGADYRTSQFNRATQAKRQPGSTFKLFAYAAALLQGIPPTATFSCAGINGISSCLNGGTGDLDMYRGFALSENPIAIRVAEAAGLTNVIKLAQDLGITADLQPNTNLVLGGYEVTMIEMIGAFSAIANQGNYLKPHSIKTILDSRDCQSQPGSGGWRKIPDTLLPRPGAPSYCRVIFDANQDLKPRPVLPSSVTATLLELMAGTVSYGTGKDAAMPQTQVVGKTGTSDQGRDLWFIGIVPAKNLVTSLWLGNDQGVTYSSSAIAVQVWAAYMRQIL